MELNQLFDTVEKTRESANWQAAFGEPQVVGEQTIIPVARVGYGFGLGFGRGTGLQEAESDPDPEAVASGEGGGGGGGALSNPLGAIVVTADEVYFEESADVTKIVLGVFLAGTIFVWQLGKTLRAIFGQR